MMENETALGRVAEFFNVWKPCRNFATPLALTGGILFVEGVKPSTKAVRCPCDKTHVSLMMILFYGRLHPFNF